MNDQNQFSRHIGERLRDKFLILADGSICKDLATSDQVKDAIYEAIEEWEDKVLHQKYRY